MVVVSVSRRGHAFSYADLEALPEDDENRYELSFGVLIVTPAPNTRHQMLMSALVAFLHARKLPTQRVLPEAELLLQSNVVKRPDVQVVDENLVGGQSVVGIPALVAEIHSPATRVLDKTEKRLVYAEHGIPAYWMIDPDDETLTVLHLKEGEYQQVAIIEADESWDVLQPFPMTIEAAEIFG
jgi:Uma2 family endonuclease